MGSLHSIRKTFKEIGKQPQKVKKFGTFGGVFTPDVLTILGVIMYLRLGWVVGNAGLLGAIVIILMAKSITICTGLSMSSITTNIKIGAGGAYSIISKSLGLEAGGSIGIPFYIAQTLSAALYIIGFTEGWLRIFPNHTPIIVSGIAWIGLLTVSYISAHFAIRIQYIIMMLIGLSLLSFFLSSAKPVGHVVLIGNFKDGNFWLMFAIFFPAVTGIMAGANLSGDLKEPRKSIPIGTMSSIFVTLLIYVGIAYFAARIASMEELRSNQMIMVDKAIWGPVVIIGIMGATLSSALGSMLGAPRILQALAKQKTIPFHDLFARKTQTNEPRNAIIFTGAIIIIALILGNLDFLAALITMFFLITYGMLNLVVFLQQSMKIISFRPTFKIPRIVPFIGAFGCLIIMFIINPVFSVIALTIIVALYLWLEKRGMESETGDIRGGLFLVLAEKASRLSMKYQRHQVSWKPDLLIPIDDPKVWAGSLSFIRSITYPSGSIFAFTATEDNMTETQRDLKDLLFPVQKEGILVNSTVIGDNDFSHGAKIVIQTLKGGALRPNILFLTLGNDVKKDCIIGGLADQASKNGLGTIILRQHPRIAFGMQKNINLWLRDKSPNWQLAMLLTLQLHLNWSGKINLTTATPDKSDEKRLNNFLEHLSNQARLPSMTEFFVLVEKFPNVLTTAPRSDLNVFGLGDQLDFEFMRETPEKTNSSCLFVKDSGWESALA